MPSRAMAAHARGFWKGRMDDIVVWQRRTAGETDEGGTISYTWPDSETFYADFEVDQGSQDDERHLADLTEVQLTAKLRVPMVKAIQITDRIKLTHRVHYELDTPLVFEIKSVDRINAFVQELMLQAASN